MIGLPPGTQVWLVAGVTDMRRGFDGLAAVVQTKLAKNPKAGKELASPARPAIVSRCSGGTAKAFACCANASNMATLCGRRPIPAACI
jgi:hypothetical protein